MTFTDFEYQRPNLEEFKENMTALLDKMQEAQTVEEELALIEQIFAMEDELQSMETLVSIRHSINTKDKFYEQEQQFFNENIPPLKELTLRFSTMLLKSKHKKQLEEKLGSLLFKQAELQQKTFKPEVIEEMQQINKLTMEYQKLLSSAQIEFEGGTYNLSQMRPFGQSLERKTRHKAQLAVSSWFKENEQALDEIYDKLVKLRHQMAIKLSYENYIQLGYDTLGRTDYNANDVKRYREQIYKHVVPLVTKLQQQKGKRIGIKKPKSYDLNLSFLTGNPTPKGDSTWQLNIAKKMYEEMSPQTGEFINFMIKHDLLDLDAKEGKAGGGYCTYIPKYQAPFIFANFNGTSGDVDVLTHEAGHAFQIFSSRNHIPPYRWPTMEAAEIHSMSMEFLAWPWIHEFFQEDTNKYKYSHLADALSFLPYGVAVDEFQHEIYSRPEMTPDERKQVWRRIEKKYLPFKDYDDDTFLEKGTYWFRQGHIFQAPFYYIDYTLAQVCAFQFWVKSQEDHAKALDDYIALCQKGGSLSFVSLVESTNLKNPFIDGTLQEIIKPISLYLENVDDEKL
jgi:M3 family oligoendopeptidase